MALLTLLQQAGATEAGIVTKESADAWQVTAGTLQFEITKTGVLRSMVVSNQVVVKENNLPLLQGELLESEIYDGWSDYAAGKVISGQWQVNSHQVKASGSAWEIEISGSLNFSHQDQLLCVQKIRADCNFSALAVTAQVKPSGKFTNRFLRSLAINMPLNLEQRKRIFQGGDRGLQWETRHIYKFTAANAVHLMPEPDHNIWRRFVTDQSSSESFSIWRSESDTTSPLIMQRGKTAPGWCGVCDQHKGVLFAYQDMVANAPKALQVAAANSGEASIYLWSPTHAPLYIINSHPLFTTWHNSVWLPFVGEFADVKPDRLLAKYWQVEQLVSDPAIRTEQPLPRAQLFTAGPADHLTPLISGGVPLPRGSLHDQNKVRLSCANRDIPLQSKAIGYWPDGSIKWLLLTFPLDQGIEQSMSGKGSKLLFEVNRRDNTSTQYQLEYGENVTSASLIQPVKINSSDEQVTVNTGTLEFKLAKGEQWITQATLNNQPVLNEQGIRSFTHFVYPEGNLISGNSASHGKIDQGFFVAETLQVEEAGPLRAVVRLEGKTNSEEAQRIIIRVEAYAGRSCIRVFQSIELLYQDPRTTFIQSMGVNIGLANQPDLHIHAGTEASSAINLPLAKRCGIRQENYLDYRAWSQNLGERYTHTHGKGSQCEGWLDVSGSKSGVTAVLRDMWQQAPGELVYDHENATLDLYFITPAQLPMDMRRYSNYPHSGQGESASYNSNWVAEKFYPKGAVVGVSKTHEFVLYFHPTLKQTPDKGMSEIASLAADVQDRPLIRCAPEWYHTCQILQPGYVLPHTEKFKRMSANLDHFTAFWLHHQQLWGWYGIWDYGDIQHFYQDGYGWNVKPEALEKMIENPELQKNHLEVERKHVFMDYATDHDWAFDNGRWGWTNTEGLPNLFFLTQYLRTGRRDLFFLCEAMARHVRDVDMRHDGCWFGCGTRHGVQHWSCGDHEERQITQSETRLHYFLTGEARTREFASKLYDRVLSKRSVSSHAAHSGRLQGVLAWWEMSGDPEVGLLVARYLDTFITPEGIAEQPAVTFPDVKRHSFKDLNQGTMFFWAFGAGHGLLEYYYLTQNKELERAIVQTAAESIKKGDNPGMRRKAVAFAAQHAQDPTPYQQSLDKWLTSNAASPLLQIVPHNPAHYSGPTSFLQHNVPGALFLMNDLFYLMCALQDDPQITEQLQTQLTTHDQNGTQPRIKPRLSWQHEYDTPALQEYMRIKNPQP